MSAGPATVPPTEIGGLAPPAGVTPNFTDPYSIANSLIAAVALCLTLTSLTTAIRLYTKLFIIKTLGWEDYTMFIAWGGFLAYCGVGYSTLKYGVGIHQWDVPITKLVHFAQGGNVSEILYAPLIAITKLSICLQFIHIFVVGHGKAFWCIQVFIWVNMLYFVACFFISIFQCAPRAKIWDPEIPGSCLNYEAYILVTGIFNFVSDLLMLLFPLVCIWKLQMSTKRRLGVSAIFFVGILALAASIMRIVFSAINNGSHDETFQLSRVAVCTTGEIAAGILAGNLVVSPRFFSTYSTKVTSFFSSFRSDRSSELLHDASPAKTLSSRLRTRNAKLSAPWPDQHSASTIQGDYMELNDPGYKAAAFPSHESHPSDTANTLGGNTDF